MDASYGVVKTSDRPDLADFQCNGALAAAKKLKQNPRALGEKIAERVRALPLFSDVSVAGPGFVNMTLSDAFLAEQLGHLSPDNGHGEWQNPTPENIVIDYGGPNVAKPLHVGHLRAAIIGEALKRMLRAAGHTVTGDVHLGDWGLQMGQLISELELRAPDLPYFVDGSEGPFPVSYTHLTLPTKA